MEDHLILLSKKIELKTIFQQTKVTFIHLFSKAVSTNYSE